MEFAGAKIICLIGARVLTILRDDRPDIVFPGLWDFPGGGREGTETPAACVLREVQEEVGLVLSHSALKWGAPMPSPTTPGVPAFWFAAQLEAARADDIVLGDEGQCWALMTPEEWHARRDVIAHFGARLDVGLAHLGLM